MKKLFFLLFVIFSMEYCNQAGSLLPTNLYSLRVIEGLGPCVCDFGEVILVPPRRLENRTIINFDIQNVPMSISNKILSKAILTFTIQNQENGLFSSIIDVRVFYDVLPERTTNYWSVGTYYKSLLDTPSVQSLDVTPLIKYAMQSQKTNINFHLSTIVTNSHCIIISPPWRQGKTSIDFLYSTNTFSIPNNFQIYSSY